MSGKKERRTRKGATPVETELRVAGTPDALFRAFESPIFTSQGEQVLSCVDLHNQYFDTEDYRLHDQGLAFRVRSDGSNYRQTLKAGDDAHAALLKRGEWEVPLENEHPRPEAFPKKAYKLLLKAAKGHELQEVFKTNVRRQSRELIVNGPNHPPSRIEAVLDIGEIVSSQGSLPIAEIELELLDGHPQSLYQMAMRLEEITPLHLETRSKSNRAFDQLTQRPPRWQQAITPVLNPSGSVEDTMVTIFESCFKQWLANQAAASDGDDPEGIHQMRIGLRRLVSALSIFGKLIPGHQRDWLLSDTRQTIKSLGPARDWDVFHSELLAPVIDSRPDDHALRRLNSKVEARRCESHRIVRDSLQGAEYTRFVLRFGQWVENRAWQAERDHIQAKRSSMLIVAFASRLLKQRYNLVLSKGKGFSHLTVTERHRLRIALKKLRYSVDFFAPLFTNKATKPFSKNLRKLQDYLGRTNDVVVAEKLLIELLEKPGNRDIGVAAGMVIGWHARDIEALEPKLGSKWKAFVKRPPFWK